MAATFDPRNPQLQCQGRAPQIVYGGLEANSQSFKAGQLVYSNSGAITLVADGGTTEVLGIAQIDATNVSASNIEIPVMLFRPDDEILFLVADDSGSLEASNTTCVAGKAYDTQIVSNKHYINSGDTTNPSFVYVGPVYDALGAVTNWGRFRPLSTENEITMQ
jgi:hypothetical protein